MTGDPLEIVVAGTAGGVGTTTVTALLFEALGRVGGAAPRPLDHTAGDLGGRLPSGDKVDEVDEHVRLHDLGRHALTSGTKRLADPDVRLVVVSAATPAGCALAQQCLDAVVSKHGAAGVSSTVVVLSGVFGRHRIRRLVLGLHRPQLGGLVSIPADLALAAGGRILPSRLSRGTRNAVQTLVAALGGGLSGPAVPVVASAADVGETAPQT